MRASVAECVLGVFAFDDDGRMISYRRFPEAPAEIAGRLLSIQRGSPTEEHRGLIRELAKKGIGEIVLESKAVSGALSREFRNMKFSQELPNLAGRMLREKLDRIAEEVGCRGHEKLMREVGLLMTEIRMRSESERRDRLVIQAVNIMDEIDKFANILMGQIREWYSTHFPELDRLVPDHEEYLKLVMDLGTRDEFTTDAIRRSLDVPEARARRIEEAARSSLGGEFGPRDTEALKSCLGEVARLYGLRKKIAEYIDGLMTEVAPNLKAVVGGTIGARLISLAGGLKQLAKMPSSTIQVLGAEKALFRALKTRARPPKHGVIYQYPEIRGAQRKKRGKIARALSGKIAIAARVDAMAGEFIGDKLASDLKARIAEIKFRDERE
ncbi:MAG: hypothetical protein QW567_00100 [Candidatus Hadarchaeales archaeon]